MHFFFFSLACLIQTSINTIYVYTKLSIYRMEQVELLITTARCMDSDNWSLFSMHFFFYLDVFTLKLFCYKKNTTMMIERKRIYKIKAITSGSFTRTLVMSCQRYILAMVFSISITWDPCLLNRPTCVSMCN